MLITEDGTGLSNAESYASVAELEAYYEKRGGLPASLANTQASATLLMTAQPTVNDTVVIDAVTYKFVSSLVDAYDVLIGATLADTKAALVAAVNNADGEGTLYGAMTDKHDYVTAYSNLTFKVNTGGSAGNLKTVGDNLTVVGDGFTTPTFTGGVDTIEVRLRVGTEYLEAVYAGAWCGSKTFPEVQALAWPRTGVLDAEGRLIDSNVIPPALKRALFSVCEQTPTTLFPTLTVGTIKSESKELGPLKKTVTYTSGKSALPRFTKVEAELAPFFGTFGNKLKRS
jgi:phosphoheptose isomerase